MSNLPTSVNVKVTYKNKTKRRNEVKSLDHLYQVVNESFHLNPKECELTYIDNEKEKVTIETQQCFEAAMHSAYNEMYYKHDQIKKESDIDDVRRKLVLLRITIKLTESKYDDDDDNEQFKFSWCPKMRGSYIDLSENDMKSQLREGAFHAVRGTKPIPRGKISQWNLDIFINTSSSGNFYGLISSEVDAGTLTKLWYNYQQPGNERIYGVDDNPAYVYEGTARVSPKWNRKVIPIKKDVKLRLTADYTYACCVLCVEMLVPPDNQYQWSYQFLLPPNKTWFPAVQFEEPGSWARIVN